MFARLALVIGALLLLGLGTLRLADPGPLQTVRALYFDQLQRIHPRSFRADLPVRVVDIDETSLARIGQWPWPRDRVAALVDRLAALGAAAIVFDVIFAEPDRMSPARIAESAAVRGALGDAGAGMLAALPDNDLRLAEGIRDRGVVLGVAEQRTAPGTPLPPRSGLVQVGAAPASGLPRAVGLTAIVPELAEAADGIGSINTSPFLEAGIVRSVPLMWQSDAGFMPGLALEGLRVALGETTFVLLGDPDHAGVVTGLRLGPFEVPSTPDGQILIHFRPDHPGLYVPAHAVLADPPDEDIAPLIEGNIVLIGTSAAGLLDIRTTALGQTVPGVSIHAQVIEQILLEAFLTRGDLVEGLEILAFLLAGMLVVGAMAVSGPVLSVMVGGVAATLFLGTSWYGFRSHGVLVDASFPLIGGAVVFGAMNAFQYFVANRQARMIRRSFAHYVAPAVLDQIERSGHRLRLGGEMQTVTVLFADIRGFTPLSERMSAPDLVALLNDLFTELGEEILAQQGTIDKFIGDAVMAFWNAPLPLPEHRRHACLAALGMRDALGRVNRRYGLPEGEAVALAIGASAGPVCVGNVGSRTRFNYSVIGDTVNVAARLEAMCRHVAYDILVPEDVAAGAADLALLDAGALALKGKTGLTRAFVVVGGPELARHPAFRALAEAHDALLVQLAADPAGFAAQIRACRDLAAGVEPGLAGFYDRIPARSEDFAGASGLQGGGSLGH